jgi:DNA repair protein RadA/Sms
MAKTRKKYVCSNCGKTSPRHMGRCPNCNEFNTFEEVIEAKPSKPSAKNASRQPVGVPRSVPTRIGEVSTEQDHRLSVPIAEFSRVLGGGLVPGSIILIGGEPGAGKSTMLLQTSALLAQEHGTHALCQW